MKKTLFLLFIALICTPVLAGSTGSDESAAQTLTPVTATVRHYEYPGQPYMEIWVELSTYVSNAHCTIRITGAGKSYERVLIIQEGRLLEERLPMGKAEIIAIGPETTQFYDLRPCIGASAEWE